MSSACPREPTTTSCARVGLPQQRAGRAPRLHDGLDRQLRVLGLPRPELRAVSSRPSSSSMQARSAGTTCAASRTSPTTSGRRRAAHRRPGRTRRRTRAPPRSVGVPSTPTSTGRVSAPAGARCRARPRPGPPRVRGQRHRDRPDQQPLDPRQAAVADDDQPRRPCLVGEHADREPGDDVRLDLEVGHRPAGLVGGGGDLPSGALEHDVPLLFPSPGCPTTWSRAHANAVTTRSGAPRRRASSAAQRAARSADSDPSTPTTTAARPPVCVIPATSGDHGAIQGPGAVIGRRARRFGTEVPVADHAVRRRLDRGRRTGRTRTRRSHDPGSRTVAVRRSPPSTTSCSCRSRSGWRCWSRCMQTVWVRTGDERYLQHDQVLGQAAS